MGDAIENSLRQEQAESFGRLMAGLSHDMKNHLGIIRESNGLMSDIIEMSGLDENDLPFSTDNLKAAIKKLEGTLNIGTGITEQIDITLTIPSIQIE